MLSQYKSALLLNTLVSDQKATLVAVPVPVTDTAGTLVVHLAVR